MKNISLKLLLLSFIFGLSFILLAIFLSPIAISKAGQTHTQYGNDFTVFYAAARNLYDFKDPYNHPIAAKTPYLYLPLFSLLLEPLAIMPLPMAATFWYWLNILFALLLIILCSRLISPDLSKQISIATILLILTTRLIIDNLLWGQVNILVALLIVIWASAHQKNKQWWGEIALAIAISIKVTPALLGFYLLVKRRWAELLRLSISFITLTLISLLPLVNAKVLLIGWFKRTILNGEGFNWSYAGNQSLKGTIDRFFTLSNTESFYYPTVNLFNLSNKISQIIFLLSAIFLIGFYIYKVTKKNFNFMIAAIASNCCLMLLLSNLSWKAHFIILTIPLTTLITYSLYGAKPLSIISTITLVLFFSLTALTTQPIIGTVLHEWFETHSYYCLITLFIFFVIICPNQEQNLQELLTNPNRDLN